MSVKVYICWSGGLSSKLGKAINDWLPNVLQFVEPYFTPDDIEKGAKWFPDICKQLESSHIGLLCLTGKNRDRPWILFEAGALSKQMERSRVCPILFDFEAKELTGPLSGFQSTTFIKEDFKKLLASINSSAEDEKLPPGRFELAFEKWWPELEKNVAEILISFKEPLDAKQPSKRGLEDMVVEILGLVRMMSRSLEAKKDLTQAIDQARAISSAFTNPERMAAFSASYGEVVKGLRSQMVETIKGLKAIMADVPHPDFSLPQALTSATLEEKK